MNFTVADCPRGLGEGAKLVVLSGALDCDAAPTLESELRALVDRSAHRIVVDLSGLTFCDSIGLSTFVTAYKACTAAGGFLRLAAPKPFLVRVLTVVGLLDALPVFETVEEACSGDGSRLAAPHRVWADR